MRLLLLFFTMITTCVSYKIMIFTPGISRSHIVFSHRLGATLKAMGHTVAIWSVRLEDNLDVVSKEVEEHKFVMKNLDTVMTQFQQMIFDEVSFIEHMRIVTAFGDVWVESCAEQMNNTKLIKQFRERKFDMAFIHSFDLCPLMIAERMGIKKMSYTMVGTYITDNANYAHGIATLPSYIPVPLMAKFGDTMTFMERMSNAAQSAMIAVLHRVMTIPRQQTALHTAPPDNEKIGPMDGLSVDVATVLVNGEGMLDFPRPLPATVSYLGSVFDAPNENSNGKPLDSKWLSLLEDTSKKGVIVLSFGTVLRAQYVPQIVRENIVRNVAAFTDYHVIVKFEDDLPGAENYEHIHVTKWMPQKKILFHPRTKVFITHGGYNSLLEGAQAGVPMVFVPLFVDQYGNALRGERLHMGVTVSKDVLKNNGTLELSDAVQRILDDPTYAASAKRMTRAYEDTLVSPRHALEHHLRRTMNPVHQKFGRSEPMKRLYFVQLYCLDVIGVWTTIVLGGLYAIFRIAKAIYKFANIARANKNT